MRLMNFKEMTFWELIKLNQKLEWELFTRIWWIVPIVLLIGILIMLLNSK